MNEEILKLLSCPMNQSELNLDDGELLANKTSYPIFDGIPWLFKEPEYSFLEWSTKIESYFKEEELYIRHLQSMVDLNSSKLTRKRLSQILDAKSKNLKVMTKTLEPFSGHQQVPVTHSTQQIHSYFQLIFRDWCWDSKENEEYFNFVEASITPNMKNILVLGCGAAKLSYDLANKFSNSNFVSLDHNPFLLLTAQKIFNGEEVKLSDYTNYPKNIESTAKQYKIKVAPNLNHNHQFILGSFPDLPVMKNSFDLIIAPWFFDILDTDYKQSLKSVMSYLKDDATFIMYGPNNIHKSNLTEQFTSEEVHEFLEPLFSKTHMEVNSLNYLNNPLTSQSRIEDVMFFKGKNPTKDEVKMPCPQKNTEIKFDPTFEHHKAINQTFFNIYKHINSDMNVSELAGKIKTEFGFNDEEAIYYASTFINKINSEINKT